MIHVRKVRETFVITSESVLPVTHVATTIPLILRTLLLSHSALFDGGNN